jgi:hypothetical protein
MPLFAIRDLPGVGAVISGGNTDDDETTDYTNGATHDD